MPIPDYQFMMLPLLRFAGDGEEHSLSQANEALVVVLGLSEEDQRELLPSGKATKLYSRISWARVYLTKAGLLRSTARGRFLITDRGRTVLQSDPSEINNKLLSTFADFTDFLAKTKTSVAATSTAVDAYVAQTPREILDSNYHILLRELAEELLTKIASCTPRFFELFVVDLLVAMGYGGSALDAGRAIGRTGDDGLDGIINEDRLGLDVIYLQAKRWKGTVGRPDIQAFVGSLEGHRAHKGVFLTTSQFSSEAREYVTRVGKQVILIDGRQLADLSIEFGLGVVEESRYLVQRLDTSYFEDR